MILLIDDVREPEWVKDPDNPGEMYSQLNVTIARTAEEGIEMLKVESWVTLLLDHDLGPGKNGMDVLRFLEENFTIDSPGRIYLVTANIIEGPKMLEIIQKWQKDGRLEKVGWIR